MANTVNKTVLLAGPRRVVVHLYIESDGVEGELIDTPILDPVTELTPPSARDESLIFTGYSSELSGFDAVLSFEAEAPGTNVPVWLFTPAGRGKQNFTHFGGVPDRSGLDATGRVLLSTTGFTSAGDCGSFIFHFTRKGV